MNHIQPPSTLRRAVLRAGLALALLAAVVGWAAPARASGTVTDCSSDADLVSKLSGGGMVTFACGTATIVLSSTQTITTNTTIDGGGTITLSGDHARRLFVVNTGARLELDNLVIENGLAKASDGGAIRNLDTLAINHSTLRDNGTTSDLNGGAIYSNNHLSISFSRFTGNQAGSGGAIYSESGVSQMNIISTTFDLNQATGTGLAGFGGAVVVTGTAPATIQFSTFTQNSGRHGGAVALSSGSTLFLNSSQLTGNQAGSGGDAGGGGIYDDSSSANLTNVTLTANTGGEGGGIDTFGGNLTLSGVTFSANSASYGAGLNIFLGTHSLTNVTLSDNAAGTSGGGIYNGRGVLNLTNVTLAGNSGSFGETGGIENVGGGPDPTLNLKNVLLAAGGQDANCGFTVAPASSDSNLSDDGSCGFGAGRDGAALQLGPLANNGGPTLTRLPLAGSPAVDGGTNSGCPGTDQRGVTRPQGLRCDVGAVERISGELGPWLFLPLARR
jgi:predicted outer membrane repeat protein